MRCRYMSLLLFLSLATTASAGEYEDLPVVYDQIRSCTNSAVGDVTCSILQDAAGSNIWTEGTPVSTNLLLLKIAKGGGGSGRKNVLVMGNQHAGEWIGYRCALDLAQFVISNRTITVWPAEARFTNHFAKFKDMNIKMLTDNADIFVVPMMNPSGYAYTRTLPAPAPDEYVHRKNRRVPTGDAGSTNGLFGAAEQPGVDLNRNWPGSDWGQIGDRPAFPGGDKTIRVSWQTNSVFYCGRPTGNNWTNWPCPPIQEKEVQAITTLSDAYTFSCVVDLHSFTPCVGWNENADTATANLRPNQGWQGDYATMQLLSAKVASLIGGGYTPQLSPYPVSGDVLWYQYEKANKQALTFLIEIADVYRPTNATAHADAVLPGQLFMMFAAVDKSFASKPTARFRKP